MFRATLALLATITLSVCADHPADPDLTPAGLDRAVEDWGVLSDPGAVPQGRWLAGVRRATARFHRFGLATDEDGGGYIVQATGCQETDEGGMGYHYLNPDLLDATLEANRPEVLLYEPQPNGRMKLVAVEYALPYTLWSGDQPPSLHGVPFQRNDVFQLWVRHAWIWQPNASGTFASWNPSVSCDHA